MNNSDERCKRFRHKWGPWVWNGRPYWLFQQGFKTCEKCGATKPPQAT